MPASAASSAQAALRFPLGMLASDVLRTAAATILKMVIPEATSAQPSAAAQGIQNAVGAAVQPQPNAAVSIVAQSFPDQASGSMAAPSPGEEPPGMGVMIEMQQQLDPQGDVAAAVTFTTAEVSTHHAFGCQTHWHTQSSAANSHV